MPVQDIAQRETQEHNFRAARNEVQSGSFEGMNVFDFKPKNASGNNYTSFYHQQTTNKSMVVLHYTAGYLQGDLPTLTQENYRVSVAFVVARNGRIYRLFNPDFWSSHLGPTAIGGNTPNSRRSVAIEISNVGYLDAVGNQLRFRGNNYCTLAEQQFYVRRTYRDKEFHATFTDEQYASLAPLVRNICTKYGIPFQTRAQASRLLPFGSAQEANSFRGIATHVNYRPTGKWDIGPAFDWSRIGL